MKTLNDYKEEYNNLPRKKNLKGKEALEAVKQNGYALLFVKEQTEKICLEAVKQNGLALQYVAKQTKKICLKAVKQDGWALPYVKEQTEEICLEAVKQDVWALLFVSEDMFKKEEDNNELKKTLELIKLLEKSLEGLKNFIK